MHGWVRTGALACMLSWMPSGFAGDLTAGEVESLCDSKADNVQKGCRSLLDGFLAGYTTGVQKGIRSTFAFDEQVLQTTDGNEDTYSRYRRIQERALCLLPPELDGAAASKLLIQYLQANPDTRQEPLGDVMEAALDAASRC
jgi:hypothetical protein